MLGIELKPIEHKPDYVLTNVGGEQFPGIDVGRVLGRDHYCVEADRHRPFVLDGHLRLAVRAQVWDGPGAADLGQPPCQPMCERDRQRHQLRCFPACVAEHQALVTRTLAVELVDALSLSPLVGVVHTLRDVRGLSANRDRDATRGDRKSTRLNSSHVEISYAVFCLKKKKKKRRAMRGRTNKTHR